MEKVRQPLTPGKIESHTEEGAFYETWIRRPVKRVLNREVAGIVNKINHIHGGIETSCVPAAPGVMGACRWGGAGARGGRLLSHRCLGFCNKKDVLLLLENELRWEQKQREVQRDSRHYFKPTEAVLWQQGASPFCSLGPDFSLRVREDERWLTQLLGQHLSRTCHMLSCLLPFI